MSSERSPKNISQELKHHTDQSQDDSSLGSTLDRRAMIGAIGALSAHVVLSGCGADQNTASGEMGAGSDGGSAGEPVAGEPVAGEPVAGEPIAGEPIAGEPVAGEALPEVCLSTPGQIEGPFYFGVDERADLSVSALMISTLWALYATPQWSVTDSRYRRWADLIFLYPILTHCSFSL